MNKTKKVLSKVLLVAVFSLIVGSVFGASEVAHADFLSDLFGSNDEISFTKFEGELGQLSGEGFDEALTSTSDLREFIIRVVNFALGFLGIFAVIVVIYGGVLYVASTGEEDRTQKGKKAITYAVIGLLIVLVSFALVNTVIRGALVGEGGNGSGQGFGTNVGGSFSAAALEVETVAVNVYNGYVFLSEVTEEVMNIQSDGSKSSLSYSDTYVAKSNMINYLLSTRSKLKNIQGKVDKFSEAYNAVNELVRKLDADIDIIQNANTGEMTFYKMTGTTLQQCSFDETGYEAAKIAADVFTVGIAGQYVDPEDFTDDGCKQYSKTLFDNWSVLQAELTDPAGSLASVINPISADYLYDIQIEVGRLHEIMRTQLSSIEAVSIGDAGTAFKNMVDNYGYTEENYISFSTGTDVDYNSGFFGKIENWGLASSTSETGEILFKALEQQVAFGDAVSKLQTVLAKLRASVTSGNAPLIVRFDVLESIDPAGGSIIDENIDWKNIDGSFTFEGETVNVNTAAVPAATCKKESQDTSDIADQGPAFRVCTFDHPGTYQATVTITSNDPSKYVAGTSTIIIKVLPPNTQIDLTMKAGSQDPVEIISYYDSGVLKTNKDYVAVILDEAKEGITFDAGETKNVKNFRWDFGDGTIQEGGELGSIQHSYKTEGRYEVSLEVENNLGEIDRKIFVVDVGKVAARILVTPDDKVLIGQAVVIDGGRSAVSSGSIKSYTWAIKKKGDELDVNLGGNTNKSSFTHEFDEPGLYEIDLAIVSNIDPNPVNAQTYELEVVSQPPVAQFDFAAPNINQPATFVFDGGKSYDPDGPDENINYEWEVNEVDQSSAPSTLKWTFDDSSPVSKQPRIKFKEKGSYEVTLTVTDSTTLNLTNPESSTITKVIEVNDILDADWDEDQIVTSILGGGDNEPGESVIDFEIISENGSAFDIDFGDEEKASGDIISGKGSISHTYTTAGKFTAIVNVYDDEDNNKTLKRNIFIGSSNLPIAKITLLVNGAEITDLSDAIVVSRKDILTFDASDSVNTDGTGRKLKYTWNFGDTEKSSNRSATHSYDELSPKENGFYEVELQVTDQDNPLITSPDKIQIDVQAEDPTFSGLQAIAIPTKGAPVTPVDVNMRVHNAEDPDGDIVQYRWWYFDLDDPDEPLGIQITQNPTAKVTIGTNGKEGQKINYGFAVEVMDSDNIKVSSYDILDEGQIPTLEVENGPNSQPEAKFKVDKTKVDVGSAVTFTSSSDDVDGEIESYIWDFEGDGFFNNEPTDKTTVEHVYEDKNLDGYEVRLKVVDDKGGEDTSEPVTIIVDSQAQPPVAAFKFEVVPGSDGKKIQFVNNSTVDEEAGADFKDFSWDFDIDSSLETADSDGDGDKTNDEDSDAKNPQRLYTDFGSYQVKLTVTDTHGNQDEVINTLKLPLANPPTAAFTYEVSEKDNSVLDTEIEVKFLNNSYADTAGDAKLKEFYWDFDTTIDSDGDGKTDNDKDSNVKEPKHNYDKPGTYTAKLTVVDNQGNSDDVVNQVEAIYSSLLDDSDDPGNPGSGNLNAFFTTTPAASADGIIYIDGDSGSVIFNFTGSSGAISSYSFDKNIHFDTNGNGVIADDIDFKTVLPGTWKTNFEKVWGKITVKLTVEDIYGNVDSVFQEIKFK